MQLSNLVFIVMLILLIIILIILYFFSSDIRKNKNNLNIAESNILSLREKISSMNDKFELLEKKIKNNQMNPDNFSEMLNQLNSINQEIMPNNMMFPMGNEDDDEEDEDDEDYEEEEEEDDEEEEEDDEEDDILDDIDEIDKTVLIFIRTYSRLKDTYVIFGRDCDAYKDELKMMKCRFQPKLIVGCKGWLCNKTEYDIINQWYKNVTRSP